MQSFSSLDQVHHVGIPVPRLVFAVNRFRESALSLLLMLGITGLISLVKPTLRLVLHFVNQNVF